MSSRSNYLNNTTASADVMSVTVPELHLGVPVQTTLSTGQQRLFEVQVGLGQTLRVDLTSSDPAASNVLFLRYNAVPTGSEYDAAYQGALQANQYAIIPSTQEGEYLILVGGQSEASANTPVTLVANVLPFEITDVQPDTGGDSKYVTTTILGAEFDPQAIVKLIRPGIGEYEPASYQVVNGTEIVAIFDLTNAPHGLYDVEVINPDGQVAVAPYRYLVEQALPPDVSVAIGGPRVLTAGQTGLYGLSLVSTTNVDIPYVELQVGVPELDGFGPNPSSGEYPHLALDHQRAVRHKPGCGRRALGQPRSGDRRQRRGPGDRLRRGFRRSLEPGRDPAGADLPRRRAARRGPRAALRHRVPVPYPGGGHAPDAPPSSSPQQTQEAAYAAGGDPRRPRRPRPRSRSWRPTRPRGPICTWPP